MFLPAIKDIERFQEYTKDNPLRVLTSACLVGDRCGVDGESYGDYITVFELVKLPNVKPVKFCPEHFSFGTPRKMPDIHGGNGFDVLDGKAKVVSDSDEDWTEGMINAANEMLRIALENKVDLAVLMDMSAACGTQVISDGCRMVEDRKYQLGPGVCAALLIRNNIQIVSQRDHKTLGLILKSLDNSRKIDSTLIDHHETDWYQSYFR